MHTNLSGSGTGANDSHVENVCDLLLEVAGRDTNRLVTVKRHVNVLDAAIPYMSPAQAKIARDRIRRFQTKWGRVLPGTENEPEIDVIPPKIRIVNWLSVRRLPERHLHVLYMAATCVWTGETSLTRICDYAYSKQIELRIRQVGYDSFREWMLQLRIAAPETSGVYRPGSLCQWWIENMDPADKHGGYRACLRLLDEVRERGQFRAWRRSVA